MSSMAKPRLVTVLAEYVLPLSFLSTTLLVPTACIQTRDEGDEGDEGDEDVVIVANGNILTMNSSQPTASATAVQDRKIAAVGDLAGVKQTVGTRYEHVDLDGRTVVPGFIESHDHLV